MILKKFYEKYKLFSKKLVFSKTCVIIELEK